MKAPKPSSESTKAQSEALILRYTRCIEEARLLCMRELNEAEDQQNRGELAAWGRYVMEGGNAMYTYIQVRDDLRTQCKIAQDEAVAKYERTKNEEIARFEQDSIEELGRREFP